MARVQKVVSDLSGTEVEEEQAVQLIVRRGPGIDRPLSIDALPSELGDLAEAPDTYVVEVRPYNGTPPTEMVVSLKELKKVVPDGNIEQVLENARNLRGRPRGSRNAT